MTKKISAILSILILSGCGSLMGETTQKMTILTPGAENSVCMLENDLVKSRAHPPQTIRVKRSVQSLTIVCTAPGNRVKSTVIDSKVSTKGALNMLTLSVPGVVYDKHSGALYHYPEVVEIDFNNVPVKAMPKPKYEDPQIKKTPETNIEYMGPGNAVLPGEKNDSILRKAATN